jgi:hypothetical protein
MIDPHEPAFPTQMFAGVNGDTPVSIHGYCPTGTGLTVRQQFAAMIAQGFAANPHAFEEWGSARQAVEAVKFADALIAELNKPKEPA